MDNKQFIRKQRDELREKRKLQKLEIEQLEAYVKAESERLLTLKTDLTDTQSALTKADELFDEWSKPPPPPPPPAPKPKEPEPIKPEPVKPEPTKPKEPSKEVEPKAARSKKRSKTD